MAEYYLDRLDNGLRLVTVPMEHLHSAEMVAYLAVGGRHENVDQGGIAHFLEHMLFRGTDEYATSRDLERAFEAIGGAVNASTDAETTCFHSRLHPDHLSEGVALFASMLRRPRFNDIDIERRIILEEAREDFNEQGLQVNPDNLMAELLWPNHPLGRSLIGSEQSIAAIGQAQLRQFHQSYYTPENLVLCCCGPVDRGLLREKVEIQFGDWRGVSPAPPLPAPEIRQQRPQSVWVKDSDSQVTIQLAFRLPGRKDPRTLQMRVLRRLLSWGGNARLTTRLREDLGLTYAVEANCSLLDDAGYLAIDIAVRPNNLLPAITELLQVIDDLRKTPIPKKELQEAINSYLFDLDFSRDQPDTQAIRYGWGLQADYLQTLEEERQALQKLTPRQLQRCAQEQFLASQLNLVVIGPWKKADRLATEKIIATYQQRQDISPIM
ncbi:MAG: pitrilysin family protein [Desulfuromonadales bacterium]|nr:pitrilysin family protein [Desulfuromonadales bacterium]